MIDAHTHVFPNWIEHMARAGLGVMHFKKIKNSASAESLKMHASYAGIGKCFVFPLPFYYFSVSRLSNDYIERIDSKMFVKFGCVSKKEDVFALKQRGFEGVKIHQHFQRNYAPKLKSILDACEKNEMIVSMHLSSKLFDFECFPREFLPLLKNRTNPIIIAHLSGVRELRDSGVFFDTALRAAKDIKMAVRAAGIGKIVFGSDFPLTDIKSEVSKIGVFRPHERRRILEKNAANILKRH